LKNHHAISLRSIFGINAFGITACFSITMGYFKAVTNAKITKTVASATITKRDLITGFNRHEHVASIIDAESCFLV